MKNYMTLLGSGYALMFLPDAMSEQDVADLDEWLKLALRSLARNARAKAEAAKAVPLDPTPTEER